MDVKTCSLVVAAAVVLGVSTVHADVPTYFLDAQTTDFEYDISCGPMGIHGFPNPGWLPEASGTHQILTIADTFETEADIPPFMKCGAWCDAFNTDPADVPGAAGIDTGDLPCDFWTFNQDTSTCYLMYVGAEDAEGNVGETLTDNNDNTSHFSQCCGSQCLEDGTLDPEPAPIECEDGWRLRLDGSCYIEVEGSTPVVF